MGDNTIHYSGHVRMMAAVQPFISGAISKTVNMPEEATVEEVEQLHIDAWKLGVKAIAIYRDNCKVGQPLSTAKKETAASPGASAAATPAEAIIRSSGLTGWSLSSLGAVQSFFSSTFGRALAHQRYWAIRHPQSAWLRSSECG